MGVADTTESLNVCRLQEECQGLQMQRAFKAQWERSSNLRLHKHLLFLNRPILTNGALPPALKTPSVQPARGGIAFPRSVRHQFHPVVCQVEVGRVAAADPPQHLAWRFRPPTELRERLVVLHAAGGRVLDAREVFVQTGQHRLADIGAEGGYLLVWADRQNEVAPLVHHAPQHGAHQRVARVEQDVVGREAAKLEREVNDLVLAVAEHRMAEFEAVFGAMIRQHDAWP